MFPRLTSLLPPATSKEQPETRCQPLGLQVMRKKTVTSSGLAVPLVGARAGDVHRSEEVGGAREGGNLQTKATVTTSGGLLTTECHRAHRQREAESSLRCCPPTSPVLKTPETPGMEGTDLDIIKDAWDKPKANVMLSRGDCQHVL